ncbi:nucleotidyltransferase-like protein [Hydrogenoanaerobacterium saccharovorans]|uniref:Nucleotidyltransferase domain-containing protein n=1 Tax=Hydrogenoanaerobacterium saccharovorans TaxID=474960 RepID=A0A1H8BK96_9FIRM|nr:nucleotidyltransferase domain-containing protein [Hydrogenoanaerobacterium saccharovorans]RPF47365.1 nucleotidyltransferase-like protein [Hydrogenoanaerobacterium saccharovorans]SEM83212.1 Nucleotidyltransferase domain-containing protein [Hydrogenoanaerobacterium saccharovorans]
MSDKDNTENILTQIAHVFNGVTGINAIVLGGSWATGTANKDSDIDIGIYYDKALFDLSSFKQKAVSLDDEHRKNVITDPDDWGPWINGGGWLNIDGIAVDILFRDTRKVITVIDDCINGKISIDYQCGHPFGFVNSIYMGEVAYCKILSSNNNIISEQKKRLIEFPENYQKASIEKFLWECEFSQQCGRKAIGKEDILYAAGSLFRCTVSLIHVLYAINRMYMLNEKGSLGRLLRRKEAYIPKDFANDMEAALSGLRKDTIQACFDRIQVQYNEIFRHSNQTMKL